ncbi:MAG: hypothetical protein ABFC96_03730 [Thermoguttaceae bacterium]
MAIPGNLRKAIEDIRQQVALLPKPLSEAELDAAADSFVAAWGSMIGEGENEAWLNARKPAFRRAARQSPPFFDINSAVKECELLKDETR